MTLITSYYITNIGTKTVQIRLTNNIIHKIFIYFKAVSCRYHIAGNVCEEENFAVCAFSVVAQIFHSQNIPSSFYVHSVCSVGVFHII